MMERDQTRNLIVSLTHYFMVLFKENYTYYTRPGGLLGSGATIGTQPVMGIYSGNAFAYGSGSDAANSNNRYIRDQFALNEFKDLTDHLSEFGSYWSNSESAHSDTPHEEKIYHETVIKEACKFRAKARPARSRFKGIASCTRRNHDVDQL